MSDFQNLSPSSSPSSSSSEAADSRLRDFGLGAQVLAHLGARAIRLLTNHPRRIVGLGGYGLEVVECLPLRPTGRVMALRDAGKP
jgi:GTP cyclohydrolase II